ncbi:MAG: hypothetical protein GY774_35395 [Planctomycetes bacterium]|nr:hypothetical protein [Planctomycetota bacterium]
MKKIVMIIAMLLITPFAYADQWCEWSGTAGINCINDRYGVISLDGVPTRTEAFINSFGLFRLTITQPAIGADETTNAEIWDKVGNQLSLTWSVRAMTQEEIDQRDSSPMSLSEYYLWTTLEATGTITIQQIQDNLPQELIDAYLARDRLENP